MSQGGSGSKKLFGANAIKRSSTSIRRGLMVVLDAAGRIMRLNRKGCELLTYDKNRR